MVHRVHSANIIKYSLNVAENCTFVQSTLALYEYYQKIVYDIMWYKVPVVHQATHLLYD